jgi:hypothetical protein
MPDRKIGKTAYVTSYVALFGILRMMSAFAEDYNIQHEQHVFKSYDEAIEWIQQ